jgi:hypothetical protein
MAAAAVAFIVPLPFRTAVAAAGLTLSTPHERPPRLLSTLNPSFSLCQMRLGDLAVFGFLKPLRTGFRRAHVYVRDTAELNGD